jgi:hypothetical protein
VQRVYGLRREDLIQDPGRETVEADRKRYDGWLAARQAAQERGARQSLHVHAVTEWARATPNGDETAAARTRRRAGHRGARWCTAGRSAIWNARACGAGHRGARRSARADQGGCESAGAHPGRAGGGSGGGHGARHRGARASPDGDAPGTPGAPAGAVARRRWRAASPTAHWWKVYPAKIEFLNYCGITASDRRPTSIPTMNMGAR